MLRIHTIESANAAKEYYSSADRSDYYAGVPEKPGIWGGEAAQLLGLKGVVKAEDFAALCDNLNPGTKEQLTKRQNVSRRVGFDFNFHPPKSVSILHALTGDKNIQLAMEGAVAETMQQIEQEMATRVRKNGAQVDRLTGNMVWAQLTHLHSRPADDGTGRIIPDPHLHGHCVAFNATYDVNERCWKAAQIGNLKRDASYYEACFHNRLIRRLQELGYEICKVGYKWEISGMPSRAVEKFSHRTDEVKKARQELENLDDKKLSDKQAAELGKRSRRLKSAGEHLSPLELKEAWLDRLTEAERESIFRCYHEAQITKSINRQYCIKSNSQSMAKEGLKFATNHCFENESVMDKRRLLAKAIEASYGDAHFETIEDVFEESDFLTYEEGGRTWCTTAQVRDEERSFIKFCRDGRHACLPIDEQPKFSLVVGLSDQQKLALIHVLESRDRVIGIRGKAGTGKTTMMTATVAAIEATGSEVRTFAPTRAAVDVLKAEGFETADTIQHFLLNEELQEQASGRMLWIDEAGLLSSRQMAKLARIAKERNCRLVLSGDTGQHSGVERGDALRILETHGALRPAELDQIFRQKDPVYNDAVKHLANGEIDSAFEKFEALGSLYQVSDRDRSTRLATDYVGSIMADRSALVVSPTHAEGSEVTQMIRRALFNNGRLYGIPKICQRLQSLRWTPAQREQAHNYQPGQIVETHASISRKLPHGFRGTVVEANSSGVVVENRMGTRVALDLTQADKFDVFEDRGISLALGDRIRISRNGKTRSGQKITNGTIGEVAAIEENGDIVLKDGKILVADFGHINHGYCVTSHSSQGRTVDDVFIAESSQSFPAASLEQFYVSCSRGRQRLRIYTDDIDELKVAISRSCARKSTHDYDWDANALLRSRREPRLQKRVNNVSSWFEDFGEPLSCDTPAPQPTPVATITPPEASSSRGSNEISTTPTIKPTTEIDL